jgi:hypothetical protein
MPLATSKLFAKSMCDVCPAQLLSDFEFDCNCKLQAAELQEAGAR